MWWHTTACFGCFQGLVLSWLPLSKMSIYCPLLGWHLHVWHAVFKPYKWLYITSDGSDYCHVQAVTGFRSIDSILLNSSIYYTGLDGRFHSPRQNVYSLSRHRIQTTANTEHHGKFQDIKYHDHERFHAPLNKIPEHLWSLLITLARRSVTI